MPSIGDVLKDMSKWLNKDSWTTVFPGGLDSLTPKQLAVIHNLLDGTKSQNLADKLEKIIDVAVKEEQNKKIAKRSTG